MNERKVSHYMNIAREISRRSPCSRRKFGAIIVKNDTIISTGFNGSARGTINCGYDIKCLKDIHHEESYKSYHYCPAVHAEVNAVINAARAGVSVIGGTLFIDELERRIVGEGPCHNCARVLINAGIKDCYYRIDEKTLLVGDLSIGYLVVNKWIARENTWMAVRGDKP